MTSPGNRKGSQELSKTLSAVTVMGSGQALIFMLRTACIRLSRVTPSLPRLLSIFTNSQAPASPVKYVASAGSHCCGVPVLQFELRRFLYAVMVGSLAHFGSFGSFP